MEIAVFLSVSVFEKYSKLERGFAADAHHFSGDGMAEFQGLGMEVETVRRLAIEGVAHDGTVHAVGVGGMHTELVGAAGLGVVVDAGSPFVGVFVLRMVLPCGVNIPLMKGGGGCFVR